MDKNTRDILVILLSQQQKLRNDIEELRREIIEETNTTINALKQTARILSSVQNLDPKKKKEAMDTLFLALDSYQSQPEFDRAIAKMETANDTVAAHTEGIIHMLKSMDCGE